MIEQFFKAAPNAALKKDIVGEPWIFLLFAREGWFWSKQIISVE